MIVKELIEELNKANQNAKVIIIDECQASEKYNKHLEEVIKFYERKDKEIKI